jgi:hypothetical protein
MAQEAAGNSWISLMHVCNRATEPHPHIPTAHRKPALGHSRSSAYSSSGIFFRFISFLKLQAGQAGAQPATGMRACMQL